MLPFLVAVPFGPKVSLEPVNVTEFSMAFPVVLTSPATQPKIIPVGRLNGPLEDSSPSVAAPPVSSRLPSLSLSS